MLSTASLAIFLAAAVALVVTPGPAVLYIVARSVDQGRLAGIVSVLGIAFGCLFHITAAAFGLSALLMSSVVAYQVVKYLGAAYLIYLGIRKLFFEKTPDDQPEAVVQQPLRRVFWQGVIVNLLNPKTALFFFAFLPQFVDPHRGSVVVQVLLLGLIFEVIAITSDSTYAMLSGTLAGWLKRSRSFLKVQRLFSGGVYLALGIGTALSGGTTSSK